MTKEAPRYNHGEAFCLMWYACECGHRERAWNSRDGVTPFGLGCPSCGTLSLQHVMGAFHDERVVSYVPYRGQLIFRDGTPEEAVQIMTKRFASMRPSDRPPLTVQNKLLRMAREEQEEWRKGWPTTERALTGPPFRFRR
jgi:hypothetical protein